jgi:hypothetical protein
MLLEAGREGRQVLVLLLEVPAVEEALLRDEEEQDGRKRRLERAASAEALGGEAPGAATMPAVTGRRAA